MLSDWFIHWLKWRTSQVSKYLNMIMLHSEIFFFSAFVISLHTLLEVPAQRLPRDQPLCLVGDVGSEARPSYFPSAGSLVCLRLFYPSLGNLCLPTALKKNKIFLQSWTTVSAGQRRACCITKCLTKESRDFLTVVLLCFFLGLQMNFYHITYQEWLQPWISFHKMMNSY